MADVAADYVNRYLELQWEAREEFAAKCCGALYAPSTPPRLSRAVRGDPSRDDVSEVSRELLTQLDSVRPLLGVVGGGPASADATRYRCARSAASVHARVHANAVSEILGVMG